MSMKLFTKDFNNDFSNHMASVSDLGTQSPFCLREYSLERAPSESCHICIDYLARVRTIFV